MFRKKSWWIAIWIVLLVIVLVGCATQNAPQGVTPQKVEEGSKGAQLEKPQDPLQKLYEAAKTEGKVVYWGPEEIGVAVEAFEKRFPGIKVEYFEIRSDDFVPRVIAEANQGRYSFDVGQGRMASLSPLLERDLISAYDDWRELVPSIPVESISENGKLLTWYNMVYPLAYNTNLLKLEDLPQTWEDLLDPKWKGKILIEVRANAFGYLGLEWGEKKMVDYVSKIKGQEPIFVKGGTTVAQQLSAGIAPLAVGTYLHKIAQMQEGEGAPISLVPKLSPLGATNTANFIIRGAPHPNAAKLLVAYLSSQEALDIQAKTTFGGPISHGGAPGLADLKKNNVKIFIESSENYIKAQELNQKAAEALGVLQ